MSPSLKLAIAIPTYNRASILDDLLWNVGPQIQRSYPAVLCYVIDNCSTDETEKVVEAHAARWAGIVYRKNEANVGLIKNIGLAITVPDAEWVWLMGDDDIPMPWAIAKLLSEIKTLEEQSEDVVFLQTTNGKVDETKQFRTESYGVTGRPDEVLTIYPNGAEAVEGGIHFMALISKLVINRRWWDQNLFDRLYRETDLYTFVRVLLETGSKHRAAYTKNLYLMATDEGSRRYYFSKTAIARVCEFPEIERMIVDTFGMSRAKQILKFGRRGWIRERGLFAAKIAVFDEEYAGQIAYLKNPVSPFPSERLLIQGIYWATRLPMVKKVLRDLYVRTRGQSVVDRVQINEAL